MAAAPLPLNLDFVFYPAPISGEEGDFFSKPMDQNIQFALLNYHTVKKDWDIGKISHDSPWTEAYCKKPFSILPVEAYAEESEKIDRRKKYLRFEQEFSQTLRPSIIINLFKNRPLPSPAPGYAAELIRGDTYKLLQPENFAHLGIPDGDLVTPNLLMIILLQNVGGLANTAQSKINEQVNKSAKNNIPAFASVQLTEVEATPYELTKDDSNCIIIRFKLRYNSILVKGNEHDDNVKYDLKQKNLIELQYKLDLSSPTPKLELQNPPRITIFGNLVDGFTLDVTAASADELQLLKNQHEQVEIDQVEREIQACMATLDDFADERRRFFIFSQADVVCAQYEALFMSLNKLSLLLSGKSNDLRVSIDINKVKATYLAKVNNFIGRFDNTVNVTEGKLQLAESFHSFLVKIGFDKQQFANPNEKRILFLKLKTFYQQGGDSDLKCEHEVVEKNAYQMMFVNAVNEVCRVAKENCEKNNSEVVKPDTKKAFGWKALGAIRDFFLAVIVPFVGAFLTKAANSLVASDLDRKVDESTTVRNKLLSDCIETRAVLESKLLVLNTVKASQLEIVGALTTKQRDAAGPAEADPRIEAVDRRERVKAEVEADRAEIARANSFAKDIDSQLKVIDQDIKVYKSKITELSNPETTPGLDKRLMDRAEKIAVRCC